MKIPQVFGPERQIPEGLDHFKCYAAEPIGDVVTHTVDLRDQFHKETGVKVLEPFALCNPVKKDGGEVLHPKAHLVFYHIAEASPFEVSSKSV